MNITNEFKQKVAAALIAARDNFGGNDAQFATQYGIPGSIYSRLKKGETEGVLADIKWITAGRLLQVKVFEDKWKVARTQIYTEIEDNLQVCKELSRSMILADDCGIGKTYCTKHIIRKMKNTFYIDCSQAKTKQQFIRLLAKTVGLDNHGKYIDVKANLKYYLTTLEKPLIILDEAGDLDYTAFLEIKELWNATDGVCGWYMIGADGLQNKIRNGIGRKKVGFAEIFSRFSDEYVKLVPNGKDDRTAFYTDLIGTVATANTPEGTNVRPLINQCLKKEATLRHLETLVKLTA
jgi:hypothetical protein